MNKPNACRRQQFRRQLAERDGARCFYCTRRFRDLTEATLDHLVPTYHGGTWARANLVLACSPCNEAKGHQLPTEFIRSRGYRSGLRPSHTTMIRQRVTALLTLTHPVPTGVLDHRVSPVLSASSPLTDTADRPRRSGPFRAVLTAVPVLLALGWLASRG
ncbi:HNH endonuclease [Streptosporangium subroseum]|uniref:HNH endonuclease n=1 Tax=Streptosporangium subroseum TaxID=106412 RepID=UPI0030851B9F|nr:HNH endonuclease [Streptosporangium subroseum]